MQEIIEIQINNDVGLHQRIFYLLRDNKQRPILATRHSPGGYSYFDQRRSAFYSIQ